MLKDVKKATPWIFQRLLDRLENETDLETYEYDELETYPELEPLLIQIATLPPQEQIAACWHFLKIGNDQFSEFPLGTVQFEQAIGSYVQAVQNARSSTQPLDHYLDHLLEACEWDMCAFGSVLPKLKAGIDTLTTSEAGYRYLIGRLADSNIPDALDWMAEYYLKLGEEEEFLNIRESHLETEAHFLQLADYWQSKRNTRRYVEVLERFVTELPVRIQIAQYAFAAEVEAPETSPVLLRLAAHYTARADNHNLCRILMTTAQYSQFTLELYQHIETLATQLGIWPDQRRILHELARGNAQLLAEILLYEHRWDEVIAFANQDIAERAQILIAEKIKDQFPLKAIGIYQKLVTDYLELGEDQHLERAWQHLAAIRSIFLSQTKDEPGWNAYVTHLKETYAYHIELHEVLNQLVTSPLEKEFLC